LISIKNISKNFGGVKAVDNCSFNIGKGSITGLIGPNGAGKTTLFSIMAGFLKPDSGSILLDNEEVAGTAPHKLFHKGLVRTFQIPHEFDGMTVLENLMIVPENQLGEQVINNFLLWKKINNQEKLIRQKAEEVLEFLNLSHLTNELAGNLSGGQKKLLELGRTMMTEPKVVLLDEPGAGVNRTLLGKLTEDIRRLNKERNYTFCIIEHDMDLIMKLCNPVVVMAQGTVMAEGTMKEIRSNKKVQEAYLGKSISDQKSEDL
jgi:branched-chain amino acid transport system ATP-binding protein